MNSTAADALSYLSDRVEDENGESSLNRTSATVLLPILNPGQFDCHRDAPRCWAIFIFFNDRFVRDPTYVVKILWPTVSSAMIPQKLRSLAPTCATGGQIFRTKSGSPDREKDDHGGTATMSHPQASLAPTQTSAVAMCRQLGSFQGIHSDATNMSFIGT
jgi:hypothetical protein